MTDEVPPFSRLIEIAALDGRTHFTMEASAEARAAIARQLDIPALRFLKSDLELTPTAAGVDVILTIDAAADRLCVVSLEPMLEEIRETYKLRLDRDFDDEAAGDDDDEWTHEPLEVDVLDLGDLIVQYLSLSLDPHPRKPGAKSLLEDYRDAATASPFAALKGLVDREG